eukprot:s2285_g3.t1
MLIFIKALMLPWPWYPMPMLQALDLAPGSKVNVQLRTDTPCPNAYVMLFSESQLEKIPVMNRQLQFRNSSFITSLWRGSLAEPINATFTVDHGLYHTLGIFQATPGARKGHPKTLIAERTMLASLNFFCGIVFILRMVYRYEDWSRLHVVMLMVFFARGAVLVALSEDLEAMSRTGLRSPLRRLSWEMMRHVQDSLILVEFMLIGLGWKITRPHIRRADASLGLRNFNIFLLSRQLVEATANQEAGAVYSQLQAYLIFRLCFLYFIMIPVLCGLGLQVLSLAMLQVWKLGVHQTSWKELLELIVPSVVAYLYRPGFTKAYRVFELCTHGRPDESDAPSPIEKPSSLSRPGSCSSISGDHTGIPPSVASAPSHAQTEPLPQREGWSSGSSTASNSSSAWFVPDDPTPSYIPFGLGPERRKSKAKSEVSPRKTARAIFAPPEEARRRRSRHPSTKDSQASSTPAGEARRLRLHRTEDSDTDSLEMQPDV